MSKVCKRNHASSALPGGRRGGGGCKECRVATNAKRYAEHPERYMLRAARHRAKMDGVECTITAADIVIPSHCPVLGIPLARGLNGHPCDSSPSLDRIIPELGYVPGNVIVISRRANVIKNNATPEELTRVGDWLRSVYPQWLLIG